MPEKRKNDDSKLASKTKLAIAAGTLATVFSVDTAEAQQRYVDSRPITHGMFDGDGTSTDWDIDGDGTAEFRLQAASQTFSTTNFQEAFHAVFMLSDVNGAGLVHGVGRDNVRVFNSGSSIGATFPNIYSGAYWYDIRDSIGSAGPPFFSAVVHRSSTNGVDNVFLGDFLENFTSAPFGDNFIGFRFDMSGQLLHGWAEMNVTEESVSITRWAYGLSTDTFVSVGDTSSVPEPGSLALLALGAAGLMSMRRKGMA